MNETGQASSHAIQQAILMAIYALFLGGVINAFVAVGLFTFYPQPSYDVGQNFDQSQIEREQWSLTAGIIMISIATLLLALSLIRWDRAIVISNGLLLGGLFTMVFGIGLTLAGGEAVSRFVVLSIALVIIVVLGYLRFARVSKGGRTPATVTRTPATAGADEAHPALASAADAELVVRVTAIEERLRSMGRALGE
jgi:hypothetical protein